MNDTFEIKLPDELVQLVSRIECNVDQCESLIFENDGNLKECIKKPNNLAAYTHLLMMLDSDQRKKLIDLCDLSHIHNHFFGLSEIYWFNEKYPMLFEALKLLECLKNKLRSISISLDKIILLPKIIPFLFNKKCSFMISDNDVLAYLLAFPHHANDILVNEKLFYNKLPFKKAVNILRRYFPSISSDELPVCSTLASDYNDLQNKGLLVELRHIILVIAKHALKPIIASTEMMRVSKELSYLDDDNRFECLIYDDTDNSASTNNIVFPTNEENIVLETLVVYDEFGRMSSKEEHFFDREESTTRTYNSLNHLISTDTKMTYRRGSLDREITLQDIILRKVVTGDNIYVYNFNIHTLAIFTFLPDHEIKAATTLFYFHRTLEDPKCNQTRDLFRFIDSFSNNYVFPFEKFDINQIKGFIHSLEKYKTPISYLYLGYLFMRSAAYHYAACDISSETIEIILMDMLRNLCAAMKYRNSDFQRCVKEMLTHVSIVYGDKYHSVNRCINKIQYLMGEKISINEFLQSDGFSNGIFKPIRSCQLKLSIPFTLSLTNASNTKHCSLEFWKEANLKRSVNVETENYNNAKLNGSTRP